MSKSSNILDEAHGFLLEAGYEESLLAREYAYSWRSEPGRLARSHADLVAFSGRPYSLQTACVAVVAGRSTVDTKEELRRLRFLATPAALVFSNGTAQLWGLRKELPQKPVLEAPRSSWQQEFRSRIVELSPGVISAAKRGDGQLSFVDLGFAEWAENIAEQTLVDILESLIKDSLATLPRSQHGDQDAERAILRLVCHLFACRVLEDKGVIKPTGTPGETLRAGAAQFPNNINSDVVDSPYIDKKCIELVYGRLRERFVFDSLTTDMLGHAYENAMVTPQLRRQLGIYYTPRVVAEYVLGRLPLESIDPADMQLCDPCCGSGSFLLAAFDRLSALPRKSMTSAQKHEYLRSRLVGMDKDGFACEMAKLSLILTDPFNRDGWQITQIEDVLTHSFKKRPAVFVTNPKFKERKESGKRTEFSAEVLKKVIDSAIPGGLLGVVLPQSILDSRSAQSAREIVLNHCDVIEVAILPSGVFYSGADTTILLLRKREDGSTGMRPESVIVRELKPMHLSSFLQGSGTQKASRFTRTYAVDSAHWINDKRRRFFVSPLMDLWTRLEESHRPLKDHAILATGLQVDKTDKTSVSDVPDPPNRKPYIDRLEVLRPFVLLTSHRLKETRWIHYGPHLRRSADEEQFKSAKVLTNATRGPGSAWRLVAAIAPKNLYFSDNFHAIRPRADGPSLGALSAILNHPLANAWFDSHCRSRKVVLDDLGRLPFPSLSSEADAELADLVKRLEGSLALKWRRAREGLFYDGLYDDIDSARILSEIDDLVYEAYGLTAEDRRQVDGLMAIDKRPI